MSFATLKFFITFLIIELSVYLRLVLKLDSNKISDDISNFISPSIIFISSISPKTFFIKISDLSAKKVKFVFFKFKLPVISAFKFETEPLAIKFSNKLFSFK